MHEFESQMKVGLHRPGLGISVAAKSSLIFAMSKCQFFMHCAKSHRPFELFANEKCKLQNEAKMNVTFERGSA